MFFGFLAEREGIVEEASIPKNEEYMRSALLDIFYCIESVYNSLTKSNGYFGSVRFIGSSAKLAHSSKIVYVLCGLWFLTSTLIYLNLKCSLLFCCFFQ